jgi:hypothetical protein
MSEYFLDALINELEENYKTQHAHSIAENFAAESRPIAPELIQQGICPGHISLMNEVIYLPANS